MAGFLLRCVMLLLLAIPSSSAAQNVNALGVQCDRVVTSDISARLGLEHCNPLQCDWDVCDTAFKDEIEALETTLPVTAPRFGARGDGTTDDTQAIQDAINAAALEYTTFGHDVIVTFPPGTYLTQTLTWKQGVHLAAAMPAAATLRYAGGTGVLLDFAASESAIDTARISGLTLDGAGNASTLVDFTDPLGFFVRFDDVRLKAAQIAVAGTDWDDLTFHGVEFRDLSTWAISLTPTAVDETAVLVLDRFNFDTSTGGGLLHIDATGNTDAIGHVFLTNGRGINRASWTTGANAFIRLDGYGGGPANAPQFRLHLQGTLWADLGENSDPVVIYVNEINALPTNQLALVGADIWLEPTVMRLFRNTLVPPPTQDYFAQVVFVPLLDEDQAEDAIWIYTRSGTNQMPGGLVLDILKFGTVYRDVSLFYFGKHTLALGAGDNLIPAAEADQELGGEDNRWELYANRILSGGPDFQPKARAADSPVQPTPRELQDSDGNVILDHSADFTAQERPERNWQLWKRGGLIKARWASRTNGVLFDLTPAGNAGEFLVRLPGISATERLHLQDSLGRTIFTVDGRGVVSATAYVQTAITTIAGGDTTPRVDASSVLMTANTAATTITTFDQGSLGQTITVLVADQYTSFDCDGSAGASVPLKCNNGVDLTWLDTDDTIRFLRTATAWVEIARSEN